MTLVIERRKRKPLRLILPQTSATEFWQPSVSPTTLSSTSSSSSSPGIENLSDLEKLAVIGHGNGGTVYRVRHKQTSAVFALKVQRFAEHNPHNLQQQQQAFREADILQRVDSQFVVKCHGVFLDHGFADTDRVIGNNLSIVVEYMQGGSLCDLLNRVTLSEGVVSNITASVLKGLAYLHGMNIVHGDIKPSNLLINNKGQIKIADFGVSHIVENTHTTATKQYHYYGSCMGTCAYMSPERIDPERWNGNGNSDGVGNHRSVNSQLGFAGDVWSLGIVVMECYMGHFPLLKSGKKPDWASLVCAICFGERIEMPKSTSMEFRDFVGRCLERDWRMRGTVDELLAHPFVTNYCRNAVVEEDLVLHF